MNKLGRWEGGDIRHKEMSLDGDGWVKRQISTPPHDELIFASNVFHNQSTCPNPTLPRLSKFPAK